MKNFQGGIKFNDIAQEILEWLIVPLEIDEVVSKVTEEYEIDYIRKSKTRYFRVIKRFS